MTRRILTLDGLIEADRLEGAAAGCPNPTRNGPSGHELTYAEAQLAATGWPNDVPLPHCCYCGAEFDPRPYRDWYYEQVGAAIYEAAKRHSTP